jgi:hypothetical protein
VYFLVLGESVHDDEAEDEVTGCAGEDWFLLFAGDAMIDGSSQRKKGGTGK